jgi:hypothetical protein
LGEIALLLWGGRNADAILGYQAVDAQVPNFPLILFKTLLVLSFVSLMDLRVYLLF